MVRHRKPLIVLFGSSIVQYSFGHRGWGATLADRYARRADVVLRGYEGWNSRQALQVLPNVFPRDDPVQPSLVIVYFGGNDSCNPDQPSHVPLDEYIRNMQKIGLYIRALSKTTRVIFLSCPPINENMLKAPRTRTYNACRDYSNACIDMCYKLRLKDPSFKVINLFRAIQRHPNWADTCFTDGIHFTSVGSDIVARAILMLISKAQWIPSLHPSNLPIEFANLDI